MVESHITIEHLEKDIRERINDRRRQHQLLSKKADWNVLCSALDVVGDTELGLNAYLKHPPIEDIGTCYLHVYAALQLLQVQQDAVVKICKALNIEPQLSPKIPEIRELRSSAIGHPIDQHENKVTKSNFIIRSSLSQYGFGLMTVFSDGRQFVERSINIPRVIESQRAALILTLKEVISILDEDEMEHREKFMQEKLSECFPPPLNYYFSKIFEAIQNPKYYPLGGTHIDMISECMEKMRVLLEKRGEWGIYEPINYLYELLSYPLEQLKIFFNNRPASKLNDQDAYIFGSFIKCQIKDLQQIASELDEKYMRKPTEDS